MKTSQLLLLAASVSFCSCTQIASTLNEPITSDYNPLDGPSVGINKRNSVQPTGPNYRPGQWVETVMPNATFFRKIPRGSATADKVLSLGTPLKVISTKSSYLRVELEGGSVGYVPAIMVDDPATATDTSPFLPPPPSSPLQRQSTENVAPPSSPSLNAQSAPLNNGGGSGSLIPPPPGFGGTAASPTPSTQAPDRNPGEILIPTTAAPTQPYFEVPETPQGPAAIPPPTNFNSIE